MPETTIWTGASSGSPDLDANWTGSKPAAGDTAIVPADATVDIEGFDHSAIGVAKMIFEPGCDINIGTEAAPWIIDIDAAPGILETAGEGNIWLKSDITLAQIRAAGSGAGEGEYRLNLISRDAGIATIECSADSGESIGIAGNAGETSKVDTIRIHGGDVTLGRGLTAITSDIALVMTGGDVICHDDIDLVTIHDGELEMFGTITDLLMMLGGTLYYRGAATTAAAILIDGVTNLTRDLRVRTITSCIKYADAGIVDPFQTLRFGVDGLTLQGCDDSRVDRGRHYGLIYTGVA